MLVFYYDEAGLPIGLGYRTNANAEGVYTNYFFDKNLQGDIVAVYNSSGTKIGTYKYDAWGNLEATTLTSNILENSIILNYNPFRYRGYYYDVETELYYLQTRYYNPEWGRFINADGYINANGDIIGFNMFAYCSNNPINLYDPSGKWIETVFDLFSLGASIVEVVVNPADIWAWAGLIGDAVDLLPFATGIGETVRTAKMVKYTDEVIDASYDTIKFIKATDKAADFADEGLDIARSLDRTADGFTISNRLDGIQIHKSFMKNGAKIPETKLRADGLDKLSETVYELKPYNISSARKGVKQILNYKNALGETYNMVIVLY